MMSLVAIDIIGTIKQFVEWVLKEVLFLISIIVFGLSAPMIFTLGTEWCVWQNPSNTSWAVAYFFLGPFACAIWMVFICHWRSARRWQRAGKLDTWRKDHGGMLSTTGKSIWFMVSGFFGSAFAEVIFVVAAYQVMPITPTREQVMLYFAIAPAFVFAPVLLVLLSRCVRRDELVAA